MTELQIKKIFKLYKDSATPLYRQLEQRFEQFIATNPPGTRLPAERQLASVLGIDRVTIQNALAKFLDDKVITRNGRRGTFIADIASQVSREKTKECFSEMAFGIHDNYLESENIIVMLYENLPIQKECWEEMIHLFNIKNPHYKAEISWVPSTVTAVDYSDYIRDKCPDIIQTYLGPRFDPIMADLPEKLACKLYDKAYNFEYLWNKPSDLLKRFVPVYYSAPLLFWNKERAKHFGVEDIEGLIHSEGFEAVLQKAALNGDNSINNNLLSEYIIKRGIPESGQQGETFIRTIFEWINDLYSKGLCKVENPKDFLDMAEDFANGRSTFLITYPSQSIHKLGDWEFEFDGAFLPRPAGWVVHSGAMGFGIYKGAVNYDSAVNFLNFILSEQAQEIVVKKMYCLAFLKKANKLFSRHFNGISENEINDVAGSIKSFWHSPKPMICPGYYKNQIFQMISEKIRFEEAFMQAKAIFKRKYEHYYPHYN